MSIRSGFLAMICVVLASACSPNTASKDDAKGRLAEYISRSFSAKGLDDRDALLGYLSGEAKTRLAAWSDEQFRAAFVDSKRQFLKLLITEVKAVSPTETNITYELSYIDQGRGRDAKVTQKKLCHMTKQEGRWVITGVSNIKELVEYQNEMSLP